MKTVQISLNSIGKVKSFVNAITQFDFDFDLISKEICVGDYFITMEELEAINKQCEELWWQNEQV